MSRVKYCFAFDYIRLPSLLLLPLPPLPLPLPLPLLLPCHVMFSNCSFVFQFHSIGSFVALSKNKRKLLLIFLLHNFTRFSSSSTSLPFFFSFLFICHFSSQRHRRIFLQHSGEMRNERRAAAAIACLPACLPYMSRNCSANTKTFGPVVS